MIRCQVCECIFERQSDWDRRWGSEWIGSKRLSALQAVVADAEDMGNSKSASSAILDEDVSGSEDGKRDGNTHLKQL